MKRYNDIRLMALAAGIPDNRVSIGIWAKLNGWKQIRKQKDKVKYIAYYR